MGCYTSKPEVDKFAPHRGYAAITADDDTTYRYVTVSAYSNQIQITTTPPKLDSLASPVTAPPNPKPSPTAQNVKTVQKTQKTILEKPYEDIKKLYTFGKELSRGKFGITYFCTENSTGQNYACRSILKRKLVSKADKEDIKREIQILQHFSGQPNIVKFKGAYEDSLSIHLVLEHCAYGELFDTINAHPHGYSERVVASLCRCIVNVVHTCHCMGVMHRDLNPENFLFSTKDKALTLKAVDFRFSVFIEEGKIYNDMVGSGCYVAPEVLLRSYGKEIDIWSAGIILYILLSGGPPFSPGTDKGLLNAVLEGELDLLSEPWPSISDSAKDLVKKMLTPDPKKRITSKQVLEHTWMRDGGEASDKPIDISVLSRMKQFRAINTFTKLGLKVMAENLAEEVKGLKETFENMDTDSSGTITYEELKTGLAQIGLMKAADVDGKGSIDYLEFISATMHRYRLERDENIHKAFQYFDKDSSGHITREELETALTKHGISDEAKIKEIVTEVYTDNDGKINYDEFCAMMRSGMPHQGPLF
ncbi:putative protein kinase CAMK-CDPK family [Medicago truncatula]|uniref:non-specific serine/threonine protein kinase n=1 Tax=Medicago truncatula TaxID=3880 RepID=A0A396IJX0_MEDTR|nr:putative protein kinase CAMK-CDPK family [Medicago truncatula]